MPTVNRKTPHRASRLFADVTEADIAAAEAYEQIFVPALFREWPAHLLAAAGVEAGHRTLDVACGTGVLARALRERVTDPLLVGLDISVGMLEVARRLCPDVHWRQGDAVALPFAAASFDRVLCQYGLMFFADRVKALAEMARVLVPDGRLAFATWDALAANPGFDEKVDVLEQVAGGAAADALRAPFCLGEPATLQRLARRAGLVEVHVATHRGQARFASLHDFVEAEVRGWLPVMGVHLAEDVIERVHAACARRLGHFVDPADGSLRLPTSAHIVSARPGAGTR